MIRALKYIVVLVVLLSIGHLAVLWMRNDSETPFKETTTQSEQKIISINDKTLSVAVANTEMLRVQGLSGRTELNVGEGMLFVFDSDGEHGIWMKDMLFPIDIVWLSASGTIVHAVERAAPESFPEVFYSPVPARYVLEVPAGFTASQGVLIGDHIEL